MSQIHLFKRAKATFQKLHHFPTNFASFSSSKFLPDNNESLPSEKVNKSELNLSIPKTDFNPRFHAVTSETRFHPLTTSYLYDWQLKRDTKKKWVIHDLPMPVYEKLHIGHFYNKVIKDVINRYKVFKGFKVDFSLGFNCHGMVIENVALREEVENKRIAKNYSDTEIREISRNYVTEKLKEYVTNFQRWGIMADFRTSYITMSPLYEACVLEVFYELLEKKLIYRDVRPMFWSVLQRRAIHEDEVDYKYEPKPGCFVKYKVINYGKDETLAQKYPNLYFIGFNTEPWTLTGCQGISLHPLMNYSIIECANGEQYIMSSQRYIAHREFLKKRGAKTSMRIVGDYFRDVTVEEPLSKREIKVCFDKQIRPTYGSGINTVCPAHFVDDLKIAQDFGLEREGYVDEKGLFTEETGDALKGKNVLRDASNVVKEKLQNEEKLLNIDEKFDTVVFIHPKSKEKIIIRAAEQWFCRIPQYIKEDFLEALSTSQIIGPQGKEVYKSLEEEISEKSEEWCISSQNAWGIPIPVFHVKGQKGKFLLEKSVISHVRKNFEKYGSDIWWQWSIVDLLPPKYKDKADLFEKGNLVFDSLFEGGCAWFAILCEKVHEKNRMVKVDEEGHLNILPSGSEVLDVEEETTLPSSSQSESKGNYPADMVVEGFDQNEALVLSMCLTAANVRESSPFAILKNHSVIVDKEFQKISKLSANKIPIDNIIHGVEKANQRQQYGSGADVARLWVAAADSVTKDYEQVGLQTKDIDIKTAEVNLIRKIYWNLLRYTSEFKFDSSTYTEFLTPVDRLMITQLQLFLHNVEKAYEAFDLSKVYRLYMDFMKYYVLDFYLETIRDRMISETGSQRQKSAQRICALVLENTLLTIAPILCHNAEDIYSHINFKEKKESIFQNFWPTISPQAITNSIELIPTFAGLTSIRESVVEQYEKIAERAHYKDTRAFEVYFVVENNANLYSMLKFLENDIADFFKCSKAVILTDTMQQPEMQYAALSSFKHRGKINNKTVEFYIKIYRSVQHKCIRCHKYVNEQENQICGNCQGFLPKNAEITGPESSQPQLP